jgi:hypothetical protein
LARWWGFGLWTLELDEKKGPAPDGRFGVGPFLLPGGPGASRYHDYK